MGILGVVGHLCQQSADIRTALKMLTRHLGLHVQGASVTVSEHAGVASLTYSILLSEVLGSEQVFNIGMADTLRFMRSLCGSRWTPTAVHFSYRAPCDVRPFQQVFNAPVRFDQETTALFFPASLLDARVENADPDLFRVLAEYVAQLDQRHGQDIHAQVRRVLWTLLPTGKASVEYVAQLFAMHRRTLHRRLAEQNTSFKQIVNQVRFDMARHVLDNTEMPLTQLAGMLGYQDTSAFSRAFKRWSCISPSAYRQSRI